MRWSALLALAVLAAAAPAHAQAPAADDVVVNEISYDPPAPQPSGNEWVEVVNRSAASVDLAGLRIVDSAGGTSAAAPSLVVAPGGFAVFVADGAAFAAAFPGVAFTELASFPTLNNTGDTVRLTLGGADLDAVPYLAAWGGTDRSLERRDPDGPSTDASNFGSTTDPALGTPGRQNSLFAVDTAAPSVDAAEATGATTVDVTFSEPVTPETAQNAANYSVSGGIGTPASATLTAPTTVRLTLGAPLTGPQSYTLTVTNVADASGNAITSAQTAFFFGQFDTPAPRDLVVNEVMFDPPPSQPSTNEWVEVVNRSPDRTFDLATLRYADAGGTAIVITTTSTPVPPGGFVVFGRDAAAFSAAYPGVAFVQTAGFPTLNNDADTPTLLLADGTVIDAVPYRASWGGTDASLERKDPNGPSTSARNFATSTDPSRATPGRQNSVFAPDTAGPTLLSATASPDGRTVTVTLDEPVDPTTATAGAFTVSGASVVSAVYDDAALTVTLTLSSPLAAGTSTVTASGLRDLVGNTTPSTSTTVTFTPDTTAPGIQSATALSSTTLRLAFTEPVTLASAQDAGTYSVDTGVGAPVSVEVELDDGVAVGAVLTFAVPFAERQAYTVTAAGLTDAAGNVGTGTAPFFFGAGDAAERRDLVVNEFLADEPAAGSPGEYVEVVNRTDKTFDLADFTLNDGSGEAVAIATTPTFVGPNGYAVVVENLADFRAVFGALPGVPVVQQTGWSALNDGGDAIVLAYVGPDGGAGGGVLVDSLTYTPAWGGVDVALERKDPDGPSTSRTNFADSVDPLRGTPGRQNSVFAPDTSGPTLASATASPDGRTATVVVDEPLDPASVTAAAFAVSGATVTAAVYDDAAQTVTLTLSAPLAAGDATVTATGLRDGLGNMTATTSTTLTFVPDTAPPGIAAFAETATTVRVTFTEPVTPASAQAATYTLDGGIGAATAVAVEVEDGAAVGALVTFGAALTERQLYTLTVAGLADLAGNVQPAATARVLFGRTDTPAAGQLVVSEIMYDPQTDDSEYLELLNTTPDRVFSLRDVTLDDGDPDDADALSETPVLVLPGEFAVIVRDGAAFAARFPGVAFAELASLSLGNSGEAVVLRASDGTVADSVFYDPEWHRAELDDATGIALERRDPAGPSNTASNWSSSLDESGGTPGRANSLSIAAPAVPRGESITVTSPFAPDDGEAARITYTLDAPAALVRVRIFDGSGRLVREVEDGRLSGQTGTVEWDGTGDDRRRLRAGIYVALLEAVDTAGATAEAHRAVIVLARR